MMRCRSWTTSGSTFARERDRKSPVSGFALDDHAVARGRRALQDIDDAFGG